MSRSSCWGLAGCREVRGAVAESRAGGSSRATVNVMLMDKSFSELTTTELYAILQLRVDVFVVEQACAYPELDGRDTEPETRHLWLPAGDGAVDDVGVASYLRVLQEGEGVRIGRVVTHPALRGTGLGRVLVQAAIDAHSRMRIDIDAQSHLAGWYGTFGFRVMGEEFLDAGIPHLPMAHMPATSMAP